MILLWQSDLSMFLELLCSDRWMFQNRTAACHCNLKMKTAMSKKSLTSVPSPKYWNRFYNGIPIHFKHRCTDNWQRLFLEFKGYGDCSIRSENMNAPQLPPKNLLEGGIACWNPRHAQHKGICIFLLNDAPIILKAFYTVNTHSFIVLDSRENPCKCCPLRVKTGQWM
jgi:hypothetical protein